MLLHVLIFFPFVDADSPACPFSCLFPFFDIGPCFSWPFFCPIIPWHLMTVPRHRVPKKRSNVKYVIACSCLMPGLDRAVTKIPENVQLLGVIKIGWPFLVPTQKKNQQPYFRGHALTTSLPCASTSLILTELWASKNAVQTRCPVRVSLSVRKTSTCPHSVLTKQPFCFIFQQIWGAAKRWCRFIFHAN